MAGEVVVNFDHCMSRRTIQIIVDSDRYTSGRTTQIFVNFDRYMSGKPGPWDDFIGTNHQKKKK